MFEVVPYKHWHIEPFLEQKINLPLKGFFTHGLGREFEKRGNAFTGLVDRVPMVCGAIEEVWENRGTVWCMFNEECKTNFIPVFRAIKKFIMASKFKRIEICIPCDFEQGKRRAKMLGFELETECARKYLPSGTDCSIYVMIKD